MLECTVRTGQNRKKILGIEGSYFPNSKSWLPGFLASRLLLFMLNYRPMADDRW